MTETITNFPDSDLKKILDLVPNRFLLASAVSKRARQISEGSKPMVEYTPNEPMNPIAIALKEIEEGKLTFDISEIAEDELDMIEELDKTFQAELESEETEKEDEKKKDSKLKSKSKSLAA